MLTKPLNGKHYLSGHAQETYRSNHVPVDRVMYSSKPKSRNYKEHWYPRG